MPFSEANFALKQPAENNWNIIGRYLGIYKSKECLIKVMKNELGTWVIKSDYYRGVEEHIKSSRSACTRPRNTGGSPGV